MAIERPRSSIPNAPDFLTGILRGQIQFGREAVLDPKTMTAEYNHAFESVNKTIKPVMDALSVLHTADISLNDKGPRIATVRRLAFPVEVNLDGNRYFIHITDGKNPQTQANSGINFFATKDSSLNPLIDSTPIVKANLHPVLKDYWCFNQESKFANLKEMIQMGKLAAFVAMEAPKQAFLKGKISPHWMERWNGRNFSMNEYPYNEGFPITYLEQKYDLVMWTGTRLIARVDDSKEFYAEGLRWKFESPELQGDKALVVAWKEHVEFPNWQQSVIDMRARQKSDTGATKLPY